MERKTVRRVVPAAVLSGSAAGALAAFLLMRRATGRPRPEAHPPAGTSEPASPPSTPAGAEEISPEALVVISAVVAAFFGKAARVRAVRQVRPTPSPWAQQGRVSIQGSHQLTRQ